MKNKLTLLLKGFILGIAFIIPGVSGGTLAVLLGIYEPLLEAVCNFYKSISNFKKYFNYLLPIGLGALLSIGIFAKVINYGLKEMPIITILIFLGMIIGGIPSLFKDIKKPKKKDYLLMLIGLVIVVGMMFLDKSNSNVSLENMTVTSYIIFFLVGALASATMVIPGISGSFTLMLIGYYEPVLNLINEITSLNNVWSNILTFLPFLLGIIVGIFLISKLINYLLDKYKDKTYYVIIGFVLSSVISVFYEVFSFDFNLIHFIIGITLMCTNAFIVNKAFNK